MSNNRDIWDLAGAGVYSTGECANYTGIPHQRINRLLYGYRSKPNGRVNVKSGFWKPEVDFDGLKAVSFREMMELRALDFFLDTGKGYEAVGKAYKTIQKATGEKFPLSSGSMKAGGGKILAVDGVKAVLSDRIAEKDDVQAVVDRFFEDVDFEGVDPVRWWINGRNKKIVIDPRRRFGAPRDAECGIETIALYDRAKLAGGIQKAANYFKVEPDCVERAVEFHTRQAREHAHPH